MVPFLRFDYIPFFFRTVQIIAVDIEITNEHEYGFATLLNTT